MATLQKSKKCRNYSNQVKIIPLFWGKLTEGQLETKELSRSELPKKWNWLYLSDFHSLWNDFHLFWEWFSLD